MHPSFPIWQNFSQHFVDAAQGLYDELQAKGYPSTKYLIVTGGVTAPQDNLPLGAGCPENLNEVRAAVGLAAFPTAGTAIPATMLGMAIHPYGYMTVPGPSNSYWRNYRAAGNNLTPCMNLSTVLLHWTAGFTTPATGGNIVTVPLLLTEDNFMSGPNPVVGPPTETPINEGTYLVDLATYLADHTLPASKKLCEKCPGRVN